MTIFRQLARPPRATYPDNKNQAVVLFEFSNPEPPVFQMAQALQVFRQASSPRRPS
jgi:hypothetical protein